MLDFGLVQSFLWREWVVCLEQIPSSMPTSAALYLLAGETIKKKNRKRKKEIDYSHCINLQASAGCNFLQFLAVKSKSVHFVSAAFVCDLYFEN